MYIFDFRFIIQSILMVESSFTHVIDIKIEFRHVHCTLYILTLHIQDEHYMCYKPVSYWLNPLEICLDTIREVNALTVRCCVAIASGTNNIQPSTGFHSCVNVTWISFDLICNAFAFLQREKREKKTDVTQNTDTIHCMTTTTAIRSQYTKVKTKIFRKKINMLEPFKLGYSMYS